MTAPVDPSDTFRDYAHPERLVSTAWLQDQLDAGAVGTRRPVRRRRHWNGQRRR